MAYCGAKLLFDVLFTDASFAPLTVMLYDRSKIIQNTCDLCGMAAIGEIFRLMGGLCLKENIEKLQLMVQKVGELVEPTKNQVDAMCGAMESMREGVMTIVHKLDHLHDVSGKGRNEPMKLMTNSA